MEYSIQQIARAAGVTSRTLRHYDSVGLLPPTRIGSNGYRYYDDRALVRLQRILLLRELGLGLEAIGQVLKAQDAQAAETRVLATHLDLLQRERERIDAQIGSVERTIDVLSMAETAQEGQEGGELMSQNIFEGFDHTQYREEVEQRWGADAYATSDRWWRGLGERGQEEWMERVHRLGLDWIEAAERGEDPASPVAQDLARRHVDWLSGVPGTPAWEETSRGDRPGPADPTAQPTPQSAPQPAVPGGDLAGYVLGLGDMYVADERFAANYGGTEGAAFVRDALRIYVERNL